MDTFLYNLRKNSKDQGLHKKRRGYENKSFKSTDRRNKSPRKKHSHHNDYNGANDNGHKAKGAEIKKLIFEISADQKRTADAFERMVLAEERKANALEAISEFLNYIPQIGRRLKADV